MTPFRDYPHGGRTLLGRRRGDSARRAYGLRLQQITGQSRCVYCGVDLIADYYRWLLLSADHVIPTGECLRLGIPIEFAEDLINLVLACTGCNGFDNRYRVDAQPQETWTLDQFVDLRDRVYTERFERIASSRAREVAFYGIKPWNTVQPVAKPNRNTLSGMRAFGIGEGLSFADELSLVASHTRLIGIDFSGSTDAGNKIWVATGQIVDDALAIDSCLRARDLPCSSADRATSFAALRSFIAAQGGAVIGLDFPFSLPKPLINAVNWTAFARSFAESYPTADAFRETCNVTAKTKTGKQELKRTTDIEQRTPFSPYNLRLFRQTYYGLRDLLAPLVIDDVVSVLPMQSPVVGKPWLIEICPASSLISFGMRKPYKGKGLAPSRAELMATLESVVPLTIPDALRQLAIDDDEGDALDSIIAAVAVFRARQTLISTPMAAPTFDPLEGWVYA